MADSDAKPAEEPSALTLQDIIEGKVPPPRSRAEAVKRFILANGKPGITVTMLEGLCGCSKATIKRWRRDGPHDKRDLPPQDRPSARGRTGADTGEPEITIEGFDAVSDLKRLARTPGLPLNTKVTVLRVIAGHENQRGRIPWESLTVDQIPEEVRHRLAGLLIKQIAWDELPEEVRKASPQRRRVYRLLGVLPADDQVAERVLTRYQGFAAELRAELVPEVVAVERPPLKVSLAVEAGKKARH